MCGCRGMGCSRVGGGGRRRIKGASSLGWFRGCPVCFGDAALGDHLAQGPAQETFLCCCCERTSLSNLRKPCEKKESFICRPKIHSSIISTGKVGPKNPRGGEWHPIPPVTTFFPLDFSTITGTTTAAKNPGQNEDPVLASWRHLSLCLSCWVYFFM